ncbi:MAG: S8 family serine peptidase [Elusimicrobia bacterium]|nr:S8 family serine peptidase [Elusimicrobiota bacterium]
MIRKLFALLLAGSVVFGPMPVAALPAAPSLAAFKDPAQREALRRAGAILFVGFKQDGALEQVRAGTDGAVERTPIEPEQAARVMRFLTSLDPADPEAGMALALRGFLAPRLPADQVEKNAFLTRDEKGKLVLTAQGRTALLDILLASDGQLLEPEAPRVLPVPVMQAGAQAERSGSLARVGERVGEAGGRIAADANAAFDGTRHSLGSFDWSALDTTPVAAGGLSGFDPKRLEGFAYDAEKGTVRVMVAANRAVETDRIKSAGDGASVYAETGLDRALFERSGATVVRAVDNLVTVDIPLPQAAAFGLALKDQGIESRPARVFKAAMGALSSPVASFLGGAVLPIPSAAVAAAAAVLPKLAEGRAQVDGEALERAGMRGKGTVVGIIDSGIDPDHPDFRDAEGNSRIAEYLDFTKEGPEDVVGHGTHVAGTIGGTGSASDGAYRGTAAQTRFKMAKVFGTKGETDESVILAAMKWMTGGGDNGLKVDILNMSLGGPGEPNVDPLSSMANRLVAKDKIIVVAAAGNEGPWTSSVGSPGNARYALTVGGVNHDGKVAFFSSRGPVVDGQNQELYGKPDLLGVSGDVDLSKIEAPTLTADAGTAQAGKPGAGLAAVAVAAAPATDACIYAPGVVAPRSGHDPDKNCVLAGNDRYRYMSGTSMATPQVAGMTADIVGYLKSQGYEVDPFQVKAVLMETAVQLAAEGKDVQGAGLVNGSRLVQAVVDRVKRGLPVGNVAYALSMRLTEKDRKALAAQTRYQLTPLGLLDSSNGHLVRDEAGIAAALRELRRPAPPVVTAAVVTETIPG